MKAPSIRIAVASAFLVGFGSAWFISHSRPVALEVRKTASELEVYSYYLGRDGQQVKDGWYYKLESDGAHEIRARYIRGEVAETHNVLYDYSAFRIPAR